jgi:hypothetical protein
MRPSNSVISRLPIPLPRYSGATLTLATPAIGTGRLCHHWRMSWNTAEPAGRPDRNAPRNVPCLTRRAVT